MTSPRNALLLLISAAFVAMGLWLATHARSEGDRAGALVVTAFFGGCLIVGLAQAMREPKPEMRADEVVFRTRRLHLAGMGLGSLLMGLGGLGMASMGAPIWLGWACALFFGLGGMFLLSWATWIGATIAVGAVGIRDSRVSRTTIPWDDITALRWAGKGYRPEIEIGFQRGGRARRLRISGLYMDGDIFWIQQTIVRFAPGRLVFEVPEHLRDDDGGDTFDDDGDD